MHSYGKIYAIGNKWLGPDLFDDPVVVEEKIDGSQFSFCLGDDGVLRFRSRKTEIHPGQGGMFAAGVEAVTALKDKLLVNHIYRGEYLQKPKHNVLAYDRVPNNHVVLWDIEVEDQRFLSWEQKRIEASRLGFDVAPLLYSGSLRKGADLSSYLDTISILGGQKVEGVVIKNYNRVDRDGKVLKAKLVSERFRELHKVDWKKTNPNTTDIRQQLADRLKTEARWDKAVQHLRERGELTETPSDIGKLIKECQNDLMQECAEDIKQWLFDWAKKDISRMVTNGLPEWYKEKL